MVSARENKRGIVARTANLTTFDPAGIALGLGVLGRGDRDHGSDGDDANELHAGLLGDVGC